MDDSFVEQDLIYLLEPRCDKVIIEVSDCKNRGHNISAYIGYVITVSKPISLEVERRYRQFVALRERLLFNWPGCFIPVLPRKHMVESNSLSVVSERRKYLTHFLNCIAKTKHLYESEQFQLFLTANTTDFRKQIQNLPKSTYRKMLQKYKQIFSDVLILDKSQLQFKVKQQITEMERFCKEGKIPLVNIKKQIRRLSLAQQNYFLKTKTLYYQALPNFQAHMKGQGLLTEQPQVIFNNNKICDVLVNRVFKDKSNCYWVIYQAVRLQLGEQQAVLDAINTMNQVKRQYNRISRTILVNESQISDINNKNFTLKQLFSKNPGILLKQLEQQNKILELQKIALLSLSDLCSSIVILKTTPEYKQKRERVWKNVWKTVIDQQIKNAENQQALLAIIGSLFETNLIKQYFSQNPYQQHKG